MTRRKRTLTEEEKALWEHVKRSVSPLERRRVRRAKATEAIVETPPVEVSAPMVPTSPEPPKKSRKGKADASKAGLPAYTPPPPPPPPAIPPLQPIDRHERRRVVRGVLAIDSRIDLHGMRQAEAHGALRGFLAHAQMRGDRLVLVITGKGIATPHFHFEEERGVLRRVVPQWLRMPDMRPFVVGFEPAHRDHGGEGALYVRLRRASRGEASS
jgi:DNA-nicking Smr family endonuclease